MGRARGSLKARLAAAQLHLFISKPQQAVSLSVFTGQLGNHVYSQLGLSLPLSWAKPLLAPLLSFARARTLPHTDH